MSVTEVSPCLSERSVRVCHRGQSMSVTEVSPCLSQRSVRVCHRDQSVSVTKVSPCLSQRSVSNVKLYYILVCIYDLHACFQYVPCRLFSWDTTVRCRVTVGATTDGRRLLRSEVSVLKHACRSPQGRLVVWWHNHGRCLAQWFDFWLYWTTCCVWLLQWHTYSVWPRSYSALFVIAEQLQKYW